MLIPATENPPLSQNPASRSRPPRLLYSAIVLFLALLVIELGLQFFFFVRGKIHPFYQQALHISPYAGLEWPQEYFAEERQTKNQFVPYRMWQRQEFQGRHLNISSDGRRRTWNPPVPAHQALKKIFCFGGSTTWGVGVMDNFIIPSFLSKKLKQCTPRKLVNNYAEKG